MGKSRRPDRYDAFDVIRVSGENLHLTLFHNVSFYVITIYSIKIYLAIFLHDVDVYYESDVSDRVEYPLSRRPIGIILHFVIKICERLLKSSQRHLSHFLQYANNVINARTVCRIKETDFEHFYHNIILFTTRSCAILFLTGVVLWVFFPSSGDQPADVSITGRQGRTEAARCGRTRRASLPQRRQIRRLTTRRCC
jgi:hypothetical protein